MVNDIEDKTLETPSPEAESSEPHSDSPKELYKLAQELLKEEDLRRASVDDKAAKLITLLAILLGGAGYFGKWILEKQLMPPQCKIDWLILVLVMLVFVVIIVSWFCVLLALRIKPYQTLKINDKIIDYFWFNDVTTIYVKYTKDTLLPIVQKNREINNGRIEQLILGHDGIFVAAFLMVFLLILIGFHEWFGADRKANYNVIIEMLSYFKSMIY